MSRHSSVSFVALVANRMRATALLGGGLLLLLPLVASAAAISVNDTSDTTGGRGCTLRDAIDSSNSDTPVGGCAAGSGADTIVFNVPPKTTIKLTSGVFLRIRDDVTILGPGASSLTIDGNKITEVFEIDSGTATISDLTIKNGAAGGDGAGISNFDTLTLTNCTLSGNSSTASTGGIFNGGFLTLTNCTLSGNSSAGGHGGGIYNDGVLTLTNSTLSGNKNLAGLGGGIYNANGGIVTLNNSTVSGNKNPGGDGGGIYNVIGGVVTLNDSTVSGNSLPGVGAGLGAGIANRGTLTLNNSTLNGNSSAGGFGGGIYNAGTGTATINNSTLNGNAVPAFGPSFAAGGGIYNEGALTLTNCTLSGNKAPKSLFSGDGVGGNIAHEGGTLTVANTIIANSQSSGGDCVHVAGTVIDNGHNLTQDPTNNCGLASAAGDLTAINPHVGALAKNGGGTKTMKLSSTSPAIGAGGPVQCAMFATDQRGWSRASCDIGAYAAP